MPLRRVKRHGLLKQAPAQQRAARGKPVKNAVLRQMPENEFSKLAPHLKFTEFSAGEYLEPAREPITAVYFMNDGVASMVVETSDGHSVGAGLLGCEDMIGLPIAGGLDQLTYSIVVQARGDGFRVSASTMREILSSSPELTRLLLRRFAVRSLGQAQNLACARLHSTVQRLSRWLLLMHDRISGDVMDTTHDFLSKMIGTDRTSISLTIADFERKGGIRRGRGGITVTDRHVLEGLACECYRVCSRFNAEIGLKGVSSSLASQPNNLEYCA